VAVPIFITAASVSAELHQAMTEARGLALTAKNARAVAVRAGSKTVGFRAITDFIEELASAIIAQSRVINHHAEKLSNQAVVAWQAENAITFFREVEREKPEHLASIQPRIRECDQNLASLDHELQIGLRDLIGQIDESNKHIRTANLIATSSHVEAATAGDFREQLEVIADNIRKTADRIASHLHRANSLLSQNHRERKIAC
tara:strand:+ start:520 stop:1128 length:609 start_codon:yes stop_codon:yes gene_type:complete